MSGDGTTSLTSKHERAHTGRGIGCEYYVGKCQPTFEVLAAALLDVLGEIAAVGEGHDHSGWLGYVTHE